MAKTNHIQLHVEGMTCSNCAIGIERHLKRKGYDHVTVNFSMQELNLEVPPGTTKDDIIDQVDDLGYKASDLTTYERIQGSRPTMEWLFLVSVVLTLPLVLAMVLPQSNLANPWLQLMLSIPVLVIGFVQFGRSAFHSILSRSPNMNVLILMGASAAFFYSLYVAVTNAGDHLYFETTAVIISLVLLGNIIEKRALGQTTSAIKELLKLQPVYANRISRTDPNRVEKVEVSDLEITDLVQVNTGDAFPADGVVKKGEGTVDEAMLTGESIPKFKRIGDQAFAGTLLKDGQLQIEISSVGRNTILSDVIELVKKTQTEKPAIQKLTDKVSGYFVLFIVLVAAVTFFAALLLFNLGFQASLLRSIAVLVISCPCAMGLATPTAIMVGVGKMYQSGILVKSGPAIEHLTNIRHLLFDKTGTLTTGELEIQEINYRGSDPQQVRGIILELENHSSHPIAEAIKKQLNGAIKMELADIREQSGSGITGKDQDGNVYRFGSGRYVEFNTPEEPYDLHLKKNEDIIASVRLSDEIRPDAYNCVRFFQDKGIDVSMLSGDNEQKCRLTAQQLGIDKWYAELMPKDKLKIVQDCTESGMTAMVGDGINDAAALSKANVSISMSQASQIAIHSSDFVLMNGDLHLISMAYRVSKLTMKTVKENLFWALSYNLVAIPLAFSGVINPMMAAVFMSISSLAVVGNSIRMKYKKID